MKDLTPKTHDERPDPEDVTPKTKMTRRCTMKDLTPKMFMTPKMCRRCVMKDLTPKMCARRRPVPIRFQGKQWARTQLLLVPGSRGAQPWFARMFGRGCRCGCSASHRTRTTPMLWQYLFRYHGSLAFWGGGSHKSATSRRVPRKVSLPGWMLASR